MDKIIDDLLGAQKMTILKEKQLLVRLQSNVYLPARGNRTNRAAVCLCHMLPHCGVQAGLTSHADGQIFIFRSHDKGETICPLVPVKNLSKKKNQKEAERSAKNPPGTQNLPYESCLPKPLNKLHMSEISPFYTLEDGAESGMGAGLCLGFQREVLNANES